MIKLDLEAEMFQAQQNLASSPKAQALSSKACLKARGQVLCLEEGQIPVWEWGKGKTGVGEELWMGGNEGG